jgi:hypothetical protein
MGANWQERASVTILMGGRKEAPGAGISHGGENEGGETTGPEPGFFLPSYNTLGKGEEAGHMAGECSLTLFRYGSVLSCLPTFLLLSLGPALAIFLPPQYCQPSISENLPHGQMIQRD